MKSLVALILIFTMISMEAFRLPSLGHFRKADEYPTFEVGHFLSYFQNLVIHQKNETKGKNWILNLTWWKSSIFISTERNQSGFGDIQEDTETTQNSLGVRIMWLYWGQNESKWCNIKAWQGK